MKKVILFSPSGYVGSFIKERMQKEKDVQLYEMTRNSNIKQYMEDYDIMIYSAAVTSVRKENTEKYIQDNVVTAISIVAFCKEHHVKRIIYLSSDEIYGELNTEVVTEKAVMVNPNLYAATKYMAEKIIEESGIPYYILRLPGIVGGIWGRTFIYSMMARIGNNEPIELYNADREFNNILEITDLTKFIALLCGCKGKNEIFLLGNTEKMELREVAFYIKELFHSASRISSIETDAKRCFTLDVKKAVEYGYSSKKIKQILDEMYLIWEGR